MPTDTDVIEFQQLYRTRFSIELDTDTARRKLLVLVRQMELVYQPIHKQMNNEHGDDDECRGSTRSK